MPEPFIENGVCESHYGLAATAAHSREAGYIYATGIVIDDVANPCTDGADHTFFEATSFRIALSSMASSEMRRVREILIYRASKDLATNRLRFRSGRAVAGARTLRRATAAGLYVTTPSRELRSKERRCGRSLGIIHVPSRDP